MIPRRIAKISDRVFGEPREPGDGRKPLEWRRSFQRVHFEVVEPTVKRIYSVNDVEWGRQIFNDPPTTEEAVRTPFVFPDVEAKPSTRLIVEGRGHSKDRLHVARELKGDERKDGNTHQVETPRGDVVVQLISTDEAEVSERFPKGAYFGNLWRLDADDPGGDHLSLCVQVPTKALEDVVATLKAEPNSRLEVDVAILGYSYEVDDFFSEWSDARDYLVERATIAPSVAVRIDQRPSRPADPHEQEVARDLPLEAPKPPSTPIAVSPLLAPLASARTALWAMTIILFLLLLK